jgi:hypothetical protein
MKIHSSIQIGDYHQNNCEDHLFVGEYGKNKILCAVMDGCTTAFESQFASLLVGKILKKICTEKGYREFIEKNVKSLTPEEDLKLILKDLLNELHLIQNQLMMNPKELLTTLIVLLFDKDQEKGIILAIGDGFVNINGKITEFEQDNRPDYIGFHLLEDFETFYNSQKQKIEVSKIQDISIATDGIFTFEKILPSKSKEKIDVISFLTTDKTNSENDQMISLKLKKLENEFGLKPTDDFSIIRVIK